MHIDNPVFLTLVQPRYQAKTPKLWFGMMSHDWHGGCPTKLILAPPPTLDNLHLGQLPEYPGVYPIYHDPMTAWRV